VERGVVQLNSDGGETRTSASGAAAFASADQSGLARHAGTPRSHDTLNPKLTILDAGS